MPRLRLNRILNVRLGSTAVVDQAVVGGTNFLTAVVVGRVAGAEQLGYYALALTAWYLLLAVFESLVTSPFTVFVHRLKETQRARYAGSALAHVGVLALLGLVGGAMISLGLLLGEARALALVYAALTLTLPFRLLRQFVRRFDYAYLRVRRALAVDIGVAVVQLGGLLAMVSIGHLTAATAIGVVGIAHAAASLLWLAMQRDMFRVVGRRLGGDFAKNWGLGKWLAASQLSGVAAAQALPWIIALKLDESATGIYAACAMLVGLGAPLLVAVQNVLAPRSAEAYATEGLEGLRRVVRKTTIILGLGIGSLVLTLLVAGEWIVTFFFGSDFAGHGKVVAMLGTSELLYALALGATSACTVLERSDLLFRCHLTGTLVTLAAAWPLVGRYGPAGAAASQMAGIGIGAVCVVASYWVLIRRGPATRSGQPASSKPPSPKPKERLPVAGGAGTNR